MARRSLRQMAAAGLCGLLSSLPAVAHEKHKHSGTSQKVPAEAVTVLNRPETAAREYFTDSRLLDQAGTPHRFYSDLLHDKIVVMNVFFSRCEDSCPVAAGKMLELQDQLGDRLGDDVYLLSISVDPEFDTVERLAAYADTLGAAPAWHFLTGDADDVFRIHARLGSFGPNSANIEPKAEAHGNTIFMANLKTGLWKKIFAPAISVDELSRELDAVMADAPEN